MTPSERDRGFTLIEVMVAVALLGLGLASLFTSQVGAIKIAQRARNTTVATLLARCKMGEIEEKIYVDGIPYDDLDETDECCEDLEHEGFACDWSIKRIVLPDQAPTEDDESAGLGGLLGGSGAESTPAEGLDPSNLGTEDLGTALSGAGGGGDMLGMITSMTYPVMKPVIEEQVRRATVTVRWTEGSREHSFDVVQFIVTEVGAAPPDPTAGPGNETDPPGPGRDNSQPEESP